MSGTLWAILFTGGGALLLIGVLALIWWRERGKPVDEYQGEVDREP